MEAACEQIAGFVPASGSIGEANALEQTGGFIWESCGGPAAGAVGGFAKRCSVADALTDLCGMRPERGSEGGKLRERCLLGDAGDVRSVLLEMNGYGEKQWAGSLRLQHVYPRRGIRL